MNSSLEFDVHIISGDHPKTAEAIGRKINLILGDTRETLSLKTGKPIEEIYEDEVSAVVVHGDSIDDLEGWQWDQSAFSFRPTLVRLSPIKLQFSVNKKLYLQGHRPNTS